MRKKKAKFQILLIISIFALLSISSMIENNIYNGQNNETSEINYEKHSLPYVSSGSLSTSYFKYYKEITIDHNQVSGSSNLLNFPVLISIFDSDLQNHTQSDGDDIAFSNDTTWLNHEIELFDKYYNETHAQLVAWIRIPSLSPSNDTIITMHYGNTTMGSQENPAGVWDNNYKGVWHLKENPAENALAAVKASGVSATASVDITTMFNGSMVVGGLGHQGGDTDPHDPGGDITTERFDIASGTSTTSDSGYAGGEINTTIAGTYTFQWTGQVSDDWSIAAIELRRAEPAVPITFDNVTTDSSSSARNTASFSHTIGEGDNPVIVVIVMSSGDHDQMKVTYGGVPLFKAVDMRGGDTSSQEWITIWYETNPPTGANDVVVYWKTTKVNDPSAVAALSYFGVAPRPLTMKDSTSNANHGTPHGNMTSSNQITGISGGALGFDGVDDNVIVVGFSNDIVNSPLTMSGWIVGPDSPPTAYAPFGIRYSLGATRPNEFYVFQHGDGNTIECTFKNSVGDGFRASPDPELNPGVWNYVAMVYDGSYIRVYIDGIEEGSASANGYFDDTTRAFKIGMVEAKPWIGSIDEVRFSDIARSVDWIATEYNNQYDPTSFFTIGSEEMHDDVPPTYSNLIESSDPLELGEIEIIEINVSDPSGINQVKIEFEGANDTMTNIGGDTWQYNSWSPNTVGNYTYIIWMQDYAHNWNSTMGTIEVIDTIPPTYSNIIESADPLQFGQNETIEITVFDLSGVNQTLLEYDSTNHSMIQDGNKWSWSKWKPTNETVVPYKIYMQDTQNNWNMTSGDITVITSYAPFIENVTESEDPLELGNDIIITVDVYDNETEVSTVLIELDGINCTMNNILGNTYEFIWTGSSVGIVIYKIYANDTGNNWNSYQASFEIEDTTAPTFSALNESDDPLELGDIETITINCIDLGGINEVRIEFEGGNHSMTKISENTWQYYPWKPKSIGNYIYIIWSEDNTNNWNKTIGSILVQDTICPIFSDLTESTNPTEIGTSPLITINVTDLAGIKQVLIEYENLNHTMLNLNEDIWQHNSWTTISSGNYSYKIYMKDNNDNMNSTNFRLMIFQDTTSPVFSDLNESSNPTEIGTLLLISINVIDIAGINEVRIEFEGNNHSMTYISGNIWKYDSWMPQIAGNYQYRIYMKDNNKNINSTNFRLMVFQDTVSPIYSNLIVNSNPLELGEKLSIKIDVDDFSGVNQCLIEFKDTNHSMINIYGNTWQYDSWTPINVAVHPYTIYMEDKNGKWNLTSDTIIVQDTTPPDTPILTISPSGKVSDIIVFDWREGSDPSGILYYILIIDNETDPESTPGYIYKLNITNIGTESSYWESSEVLPSGEYYYFLAQIDGVGLQSNYTVGTFTVIDSPRINDFMIFIIIGLILAIIISSLIVAIVVRKKLQKKVTPYIKKIPLKIIIPHLNKISSLPLDLVKKDFRNKVIEIKQDLEFSDEEFIDEDKLQIKVNEIKNFGEALFNDGAYLEAQKQFELGKEFLLKYGKEEDAKLFSELSSVIKGLNDEREKRLEILEQVKNEGNSMKIFEIYYDIIEISKKLRDLDGVNLYKSDLIQFFKTNKFKLINIKRNIFDLEQEADLLIRNDLFEKAAHLYEKCEKISEFLFQLGNKEEKNNVRKFKNKKDECLKNSH